MGDWGCLQTCTTRGYARQRRSKVRNVSTTARVDHMRFLSDTDKRDIYEAALYVLSDVGMTLHHEGAVKLLLDGGCRVDSAGRVRVPRRLVEEARDSVPSVIRVYDREGDLAMELGHYNSYFGPGSDLMSTYDIETGEHRPSSLEDVANAARVVDALPNIDFVMSSAYPNEAEPQESYLRSYAAMMRNTTKPLVMTALDGKDLRLMCDVASHSGAAREPAQQALLHRLQRARQPALALVRERQRSCLSARRPVCPPSTPRPRSWAPRLP